MLMSFCATVLSNSRPSMSLMARHSCSRSSLSSVSLLGATLMCLSMRVTAMSGCFSHSSDVTIISRSVTLASRSRLLSFASAILVSVASRLSCAWLARSYTSCTPRVSSAYSRALFAMLTTLRYPTVTRQRLRTIGSSFAPPLERPLARPLILYQPLADVALLLDLARFLQRGRDIDSAARSWSERCNRSLHRIFHIRRCLGLARPHR